MIRIPSGRLFLRSENKHQKRNQNRSHLTVTRSLGSYYVGCANGEAPAMALPGIGRKVRRLGDKASSVQYGSERLTYLLGGGGPSRIQIQLLRFIRGKLEQDLGTSPRRCAMPPGPEIEFELAPKWGFRGRFCGRILSPKSGIKMRPNNWLIDEFLPRAQNAVSF